MKIHEVEQGSKEWHIMRFGRVGGTESPQLHTKSDALLNELVSARLEPWYDEDNFVSKEMQRGKDLEPIAREKGGEYLKLKFLEFGYCTSDECDLLGLSPDGFTEDLTEGIEIKCPTRKVHTSYLRLKKIPKEYVQQVLHYFAVNEKLKKMHFVSFRPECKIPIKVITVSKFDFVDIGTDAKPNMVAVAAIAEEKVNLGKALQIEIEKTVKELSF